MRRQERQRFVRAGGSDPARRPGADGVEPPCRPQRSTAVKTHGAERVRRGEAFNGGAGNAGDGGKLRDRGKTIAAQSDELFQLVFVKPLDEPEAEAHGM